MNRAGKPKIAIDSCQLFGIISASEPVMYQLGLKPLPPVTPMTALRTREDGEGGNRRTSMQPPNVVSPTLAVILLGRRVQGIQQVEQSQTIEYQRKPERTSR